MHFSLDYVEKSLQEVVNHKNYCVTSLHFNYHHRCIFVNLLSNKLYKIIIPMSYLTPLNFVEEHSKHTLSDDLLVSEPKKKEKGNYQSRLYLAVNLKFCFTSKKLFNCLFCLSLHIFILTVCFFHLKV